MTAVSRRLTKTTADSRKLQQDRGIAIAELQAIVWTIVTSPERLLWCLSPLFLAPVSPAWAVSPRN